MLLSALRPPDPNSSADRAGWGASKEAAGGERRGLSALKRPLPLAGTQLSGPREALGGRGPPPTRPIPLRGAPCSVHGSRPSQQPTSQGATEPEPPSGVEEAARDVLGVQTAHVRSSPFLSTSGFFLSREHCPHLQNLSKNIPKMYPPKGDRRPISAQHEGLPALQSLTPTPTHPRGQEEGREGGPRRPLPRGLFNLKVRHQGWLCRHTTAHWGQCSAGVTSSPLIKCYFVNEIQRDRGVCRAREMACDPNGPGLPFRQRGPSASHPSPGGRPGLSVPTLESETRPERELGTRVLVSPAFHTSEGGRGSWGWGAVPSARQGRNTHAGCSDPAHTSDALIFAFKSGITRLEEERQNSG